MSNVLNSTTIKDYRKLGRYEDGCFHKTCSQLILNFWDFLIKSFYRQTCGVSEHGLGERIEFKCTWVSKDHYDNAGREMRT